MFKGTVEGDVVKGTIEAYQGWIDGGLRKLRVQAAVNAGGTRPWARQLIGEHTDLQRSPVLPMAPGPGDCASLPASRRPARETSQHRPAISALDFELGEEIPPEAGGAWGNYVRAAGQALWREVGALRGIEGEITSTIPVASGLSSSSGDGGCHGDRSPRCQ
jgi:galactokinase